MFSIFHYIRDGQYLLAIISILSSCFVVFCCLPIHEYAHGYVAYKLGDDTAKRQGRLTLSPLGHLNPLGTVMLFLFGIGFANPVPVNPNNLKNPKKDMLFVSLAGPLSNLLLAYVSNFIYIAIASNASTVGFVGALAYFFYFATQVNIMLAVFNLLPIPPLDGATVLAAVLPDKTYYKYMRIEQFAMPLLMLLLFIGILDVPIAFLSNLISKFISIIPNLIFVR